MIKINGRIYSGNTITIINGRVVNGGKTGELKKFDEKKTEAADKVEKIKINSSSVDVNISASNSSNIETYFYGLANVDGEIKFDVQLVNRELKITLEFEGSSYDGDLKLDVVVPYKTFKMIFAKSSSADIILNEGVLTEQLKVETMSGDVEIEAMFNAISVTTMSGDVELYANANKDISVDISTMSGDVSAEFNNIGHINFNPNTTSGDVRNRHKERKGYTANVDVYTMSGDIKIR